MAATLIDIRGGFLMLTKQDGGESHGAIRGIIAVKGSTIESIQSCDSGSRISTIGGEVFSVTELPGDILTAITQSYKEVTGKR